MDQIRVCPGCGQKNRIPARAMDAIAAEELSPTPVPPAPAVRCGKCHRDFEIDELFAHDFHATGGGR